MTSLETDTKSLKFLLSEYDWINISITKDINANKIQKFSINLTSIINGKPYPVIRYDNAHGFSHIDRYWSSEKEILHDVSKKEVVQRAHQDLTTNWQQYRKKVEMLIEGD